MFFKLDGLPRSSGRVLLEDEVASGGGNDDDGEVEEEVGALGEDAGRIFDNEVVRDHVLPSISQTGVVRVGVVVDAEGVALVLVVGEGLLRRGGAGEPHGVGTAEAVRGISVVGVASDLEGIDPGIVVELVRLLNGPVAREVVRHGDLEDEHLAGRHGEGLDVLAGVEVAHVVGLARGAEAGRGEVNVGNLAGPLEQVVGSVLEAIEPVGIGESLSVQSIDLSRVLSIPDALRTSSCWSVDKLPRLGIHSGQGHESGGELHIKEII